MQSIYTNKRMLGLWCYRYIKSSYSLDAIRVKPQIAYFCQL
jgi:hypothetical protein